MVKTTQHFEPDELISKELTLARDSIGHILATVLVNPDQFIQLASKNKTIDPKFP